MHSLDQQVLQQLHSWLQQGLSAWLCTIIATHGSAPRPKGSLMVMSEQGDVVGSLSGGCVEEDLLENLSDFQQTSPQICEYGLSAEENERLGLPCGGHLTVLVEKLSPSDADSFAQINSALKQRSCIKRTVNCESGAFENLAVDKFENLEYQHPNLSQVFGPRYSLLLVGAGHIAECLAPMAAMMDYRVIVTDPREDKLKFFQQHLGSDAADIECVNGMPDDVVREHASDPFSIVITLTHDPRIDDMALMEALTHESFYVGALGSMRTSEKRRARLLELDLTEQTN